MTSVLSIQNANLAFSDRALWSNLNLEVKPHEFIAVLGTNGSGKTTLLRAILGQQKIDSGTIEINGKPVNSQKDVEKVLNNYKGTVSIKFMDEYGRIYQKGFKMP